MTYEEKIKEMLASNDPIIHGFAARVIAKANLLSVTTQKEGGAAADYSHEIAPDAAPAPDGRTLPPWHQLAANFVKAGAKQVAAGNPQATETSQIERLEICYSCENCSFATPDGLRRATRNDDVNSLRCAGEKGCGCYLMKKITWATAECPLGKWPKFNAPSILDHLFGGK